MSARNCLTPYELSEFSTGRFDEDKIAAIAAHLSDCATCLANLSEIETAADPLIVSLHGLQATDPIVEEPACQQLRERILTASQIGHASSDEEGKLSPGESIGHYEIQRLVGRGGMGVVYLAVDRRSGDPVALKVMSNRHAPDPNSTHRFSREMRAVAELDHQNIVRAIDAGESDGTAFIAMEYIDGVDLSKLVAHHGPLPPPDACEIIRQAALALEHAHQRGLMHRDIKPSNLMIATNSDQPSAVSPSSIQNSHSAVRNRKSAFVKVLDFGLARLQSSPGVDTELTMTGQLLGTPDYMAPERKRDSRAVDIRSDIYSLGVTLLKLLTGQTPTIATKTDELPAELSPVIDRMIAPEPEARYATPADVADAMEPLARGNDLASLVSADKAIGRLPIEPARKHTSGSRTSNWWRTVTGLAFSLVVLSAIYLSTNYGTLVIRSDESVEVHIRRSGKTVRRMRVDEGQQQTTLYAGEYEIELANTDGIRLDIKPDKFRVLRGEDVVAAVEYESATPPDSPAADEKIQALHDSIEESAQHREIAQWIGDIDGYCNVLVDGASAPQDYRKAPQSRGFRIVEVSLKFRAAEAAVATRLEPLAGLSTVEHITVFGAIFNDQCLRQLATLSNLKSLELHEPYKSHQTSTITSEGLAALAELNKLESLSLASLPVNDAGVETISQITSLRELRLSNTAITDATVVHLQRIPNLAELDLGSTEITDRGMAVLALMKGLRRLNLQGTAVTGAGMAGVAQLPDLEELRISALIGDEGMMHVGKLPNLRTLVIEAGNGRRDLRVSDAGLSQLKNCTELRTMVLTNCNIDGSGFGHLADLTKLEELIVRNTDVTDQSMKELAQIHSLKQLNLQGTNVSDAGMAHLVSLAQLEQLGVRSTNVTPQGAKTITDAIPNCRVRVGRQSLDTPDPNSGSPPRPVRPKR